MVSPFFLQGIRTGDGTEVRVPEAGVLCVVGGNNVGKSRFLREVASFFEHGSEQMSRLIVESITPILRLEESNAAQWLMDNHSINNSIGPASMYCSEGGFSCETPEIFVQSLLLQSPPLWASIGQFFVRRIEFEERSHIAARSIGHGNLDQHETAVDKIFADGHLEQRLSDLSERVFGFPLTLDRLARDMCLRIGKSNEPVPPLNHPTREYADSVSELPLLSEQGDGVKNFLGIVLHQMSTTLSTVLLDEPEAFLHPAQSRALGEYLGKEMMSHQRQLITATHDRDFLIGLMNSGVELSVLRLDRVDGGQQRFTLIDSNEIAQIWTDPVLRFSNLLQGLFHRTVVLCEADADCLWYTAVLSSMGEKLGVDTNEVLFLPSAGKHKLRSFVGILESLNVPTFVVVDFDALLGTNPEVIRLLENKPGDHSQLLESITNFARDVANDGREKIAKENGLAGLASGTSTVAGNRIVKSLERLGILVVPVGELESFDKSIGGHGYKWVTQALDSLLYSMSDEAQEFLKPVIGKLQGESTFDTK